MTWISYFNAKDHKQIRAITTVILLTADFIALILASTDNT